MNPILVVLLLMVLIIIFSQFGGKISATSAWHWWVVGIFLVIAAYEPEFYRPIANILGIRFISNFVLASLVMFLFMQGLSNHMANVFLNRRQRQFISSEALKRYLTPLQLNVSPRVLVILPTFNEQENIKFMAEDLAKLSASDHALHYCFVNDGSTDNTTEALKAVGREHYIEHLTNINVSGVLRTGFDLAHELKAQYVVQCDADGQHPVSEILRLVKEAEECDIDCLIGSRYVQQSMGERLRHESTTVLRVIGSQSLRWVLQVLFGARIADPTSGFRVYSQRAIQLLRTDLPDEYPEPESIAIMASNGLKIAETPVSMKARTAGVSSLSGWKSLAYMSKVISALLGLRIRSLIG